MKLFRWIFFFTVLANVALIVLIKSNHQEEHQANINLNSVQDGDIVLRDSRSLIGTQFKMMSQHNKRFSHAGIIRKENKSSDKPGIRTAFSMPASWETASLVTVAKSD